MARYQFDQASSRLHDSYEVYDGDDPSPPFASLMTMYNAERLAALLNATAKGCGGGSLALISDDELGHLAANIGREQARREKLPKPRTGVEGEIDRDIASGAGIAGDTLDALDPD